MFGYKDAEMVGLNAGELLKPETGNGTELGPEALQHWLRRRGGSSGALADQLEALLEAELGVPPSARSLALRDAVLGDTLVRALRHRGHQVGVQNYIDDTGVQVADVVVGFETLEGEGAELTPDGTLGAPRTGGLGAT